MKKLLAPLAVACMTACAALESYEFGDATRAALKTAEKVNALKAEYCSAPNGPSRELILETIRHLEPEYPGVCSVAP